VQQLPSVLYGGGVNVRQWRMATLSSRSGVRRNGHHDHNNDRMATAPPPRDSHATMLEDTKRILPLTSDAPIIINKDTPLSSLLTLVITTSPIRSNPSIEMISQLLCSIADHWPDACACRIIIVADGCSISDDIVATTLPRSRLTSSSPSLSPLSLPTLTVAETLTSTTAGSDTIRSSKGETVMDEQKNGKADVDVSLTMISDNTHATPPLSSSSTIKIQADAKRSDTNETRNGKAVVPATRWKDGRVSRQQSHAYGHFITNLCEWLSSSLCSSLPFTNGIDIVTRSERFGFAGNVITSSPPLPYVPLLNASHSLNTTLM
jgi:hypothetical protein